MNEREVRLDLGALVSRVRVLLDAECPGDVASLVEPPLGSQLAQALRELDTHRRRQWMECHHSLHYNNMRLIRAQFTPQGCAVDRASVRQKKTGHPVKFELTEATRQSLDDY